jgi:hypothetical protein
MVAVELSVQGTFPGPGHSVSQADLLVLRMDLAGAINQ